MSNFVVVSKDGTKVACRGWSAFGSAYAKAYGWSVLWKDRLKGHPDVLTWETDGGALKFTAMNGGIVKPFAEVADAVVNTAAV